MTELQPYKLSPAYRSLQKLGAKWGSTGGWQTADSFSAPEVEISRVPDGVGLCDLSHYRKAEVRGRDIDRTFPGLPARGSARVQGSNIIYRFTQDEVLVCSSVDTDISALLNDGRFDVCSHVTERTSGLACFLLAGPKAVDVLNRLTSLDLRESRFLNLACARAPLAHVNVRIARHDRRNLRAYEILPNREYGEYVWDTIWRTGEPFGITAFGLKALSFLDT